MARTVKTRLYAHPMRRNNRGPGGQGGNNPYGFFPEPGKNYTYGDEPKIATALSKLGQALKLHLIGISGYRTPQHSVEVGGFADDPHTRGQASDTGGAENIPEATLERFGLTRPFNGAAEANHIQLLRSRSPSTTTGSPSQQTAVQQAATRWGIPVNILTGVWGMETGFGQNVKTSSAGAIGDFQFLPSTAKAEGGYPLTNTPNAKQFAQQADTAAKYLSQLYKAHKNWNDALLAYSGGGYGLKEVQAKAPRGRSFGGGNATPRTRPGGGSSGSGGSSSGTDGPDVTTVLSDWATARDGDASEGDGNQFTSFGIGPIPGLPLITNPLDLFKSLSGSIHDAKDFFKLLAWIINPVNILRMVEFLAGLTFMALGFHAMLQAYRDGGGGGGLSSAGLGRVSREVSRAATAAVPEAKAASVAKQTVKSNSGGNKQKASKSMAQTASMHRKNATAAKSGKPKLSVA